MWGNRLRQDRYYLLLLKKLLVKPRRQDNGVFWKVLPEVAGLEDPIPVPSDRLLRPGGEVAIVIGNGAKIYLPIKCGTTSGRDLVSRLEYPRETSDLHRLAFPSHGLPATAFSIGPDPYSR